MCKEFADLSERLGQLEREQADGSAKTREVKLGCVFTQTTFDDQDRPIRDPHTTTFVGAIEDAHTFGAARRYPEAVRRGLYQARCVVFIGSGVIEAGCKAIACQRLKQSGME